MIDTVYKIYETKFVILKQMHNNKQEKLCKLNKNIHWN